ncbi:LTA synthase family protein [Neobacillus massiliamazoniensis]|uniref:Putative exported enzyme and anion transporter n=1 Tax=Neobacillus massiliamazoniensis TaxID=1499688 RepID=A0A0U1P3J2_9BACI|nr:LTA synthase family protein [Neobacillus massiliamazoniensis]CRK84827.1 putative exported enzyme and anion transporter [Neobacillus massiliamazoniensis]
MKKNAYNHFVFFVIAVLLFWFKTYIAYHLDFRLGTDNNLQRFLLFINPLSSALFFLGFALLSKKYFKRVLIGIHFILSFLLYANIVYYRFFNDFITVPDLLQAKSNAGGLGDSVVGLMAFSDIFYFTDTIILIVLACTLFKQATVKTWKLYKFVFLISIIIFLMNLSLAEKDRPNLLSLNFDRSYIVKYLGVYNFTIFDIIQSIQSSSERAFASSNNLTKVENYRKATYTTPDPVLFGKAKGMNVIFVSMESFQNFMIDLKMPNGELVTPFLDSLAHDGDTFYFDHFYHQTGQGKTSDAEFLMENSLYPLNQGSVFISKAQNTYQATPGILKGYGYNSAVFHGNYKTFWNRNVMYKSLGYDQFFDASYYNLTPPNIKNFGMKDKPFFAESMPMLENLKQPFYTKFITLSNHFPFEIDQGDTNFPKGNTGDWAVDQYMQSAHYMDEALQQFFDSLKKDGLYDKSVIILYGDHYGLSSNNYPAMAKMLGVKQITPVMDSNLQQVPLFIHVPGVKGGVEHQVGGEVDVRPTLLHLLGIDTKDYIEFGSDLLSPQHRNWVAFRNGDYVSTDLIMSSGKCYSVTTRNLATDQKACNNLSNKVKNDLQMSDTVVNQDLLRFYHPNGFKPINPSDYQYLGPTKKKGA